MQLRILIAVLAVILSACEQEVEDWQTAKVHAASALHSGNCEEAWGLVWPWAKRGNVEARAILATGVLAAGLNPPGSSGDSISQFRHSLILAVHGAALGDRAVTEMLNALIETELVSAMGGRSLKTCLKETDQFAICVEDAVRDGLVPAFDDYAREIDSAAISPGAPAASCGRLSESDGQTLPVPMDGNEQDSAQ